MNYRCQRAGFGEACAGCLAKQDGVLLITGRRMERPAKLAGRIRRSTQNLYQFVLGISVTVQATENRLLQIYPRNFSRFECVGLYNAGPALGLSRPMPLIGDWERMVEF